MPSEDSYIVVFDGEDELASQRFVTDLHDPERGRVVVEVLIGDRTRLGLAQALLAGVGKDLDLPGSDRAGRTSWQQALIWSNVVGVNELFVTRAHLLDGGGWQCLCELATACGVRLWLLNQVEQPTRGQRDALRRWPFRRIEHAEFERRWGGSVSVPAQERPRPPRPDPGAFPEVPEADFAFFRAACRQSLSAADFEIVDQAFMVGFDAATTRLPKSAEDVCAVLAGLAQTASSVDEALARIRGLQAGLLWRGWLIRTDLTRCRAWLSERLDLREARALGARLMSCAAPAWGCLGAMTLYLDLSPSELATATILNLSKLASETEIVVLRRCCRAQLLARQYEGAALTDPAFVDLDDAPARPRFIRRRLGLLAENLGLPLIRERRAVVERAPRLLARDQGFRVSSVLRGIGG